LIDPQDIFLVSSILLFFSFFESSNYSEGGMHTNMEMSHEFDQHPYGDMQDTSIEMGHEEIMDKNGKKRNAINYRCRVGANQMNYQFGYDPACAA